MNDLYTMSRFLVDNAQNPEIVPLDEASQTGATEIVLNQILQITVGKYSKIDFSEIERSRGDITKCRFYKNLNECINTLVDIHNVNEGIPEIIPVSTALDNVITLKNAFEYAFKIQNAAVIFLYNSICYAILEVCSYLICAAIYLVKNKNEMEIKTYKPDDGRDIILLNSINKFNEIVDNGVINKFFALTNGCTMDINNESVEIITESIASDIAQGFLNLVQRLLTHAPVAGDATVNSVANAFNNSKIKKVVIGGLAATGVVIILINIIPIIREIIYWVYKAKHKISELAKTQADFLEMNIEILKDGEGNDKVIANQQHAADIFNAIASKFALQSDKVDRDVQQEIKSDQIEISY